VVELELLERSERTVPLLLEADSFLLARSGDSNPVIDSLGLPQEGASDEDDAAEGEHGRQSKRQHLHQQMVGR